MLVQDAQNKGLSLGNIMAKIDPVNIVMFLFALGVVSTATAQVLL